MRVGDILIESVKNLRESKTMKWRGKKDYTKNKN